MTVKNVNPYIPSKLNAAQENARPITVTRESAGLSDSNIGDVHKSFKYDPLSYPLKSTQQLNVDWTKFENHTFFSSAEVKVNEAFNNIINFYPFDGTKSEIESFIDSPPLL